MASTITATTTTAPAPASLCMIPGPIELHEDVARAAGAPALSHVSPVFIESFGQCIENLRKIHLADATAQPFVVSGSGTLGWDMVGANLIAPGDTVLVVNTGYFGDSFGECLSAYGASVSHVRAEKVGSRPSLDAIRRALTAATAYKAVTITHVDTSTGVLTDIAAIAQLVRSIHKDTLVVVDGVCSVAGEEIRMKDWDVDVVLTASQKALSAPPGLCILVASQRAMNVFNSRTAPIQGYYASWKRWLPIMNAYEARKPSYFATPPVQLISALNISLKQILDYGMEDVFARHRDVSRHIKDTLASWGLKLVAVERDMAANTLSAVYLPQGVTNPDLLPRLVKRGIITAGGLHKEIAAQYFRIGHMGVATVMQEKERGYVERTLASLKASLEECGYKTQA